MKGFDRSAPSYLKAMAILSRTDPESASGPVTTDFPVPPPRKRNRTQSYAHEDSADQYAGSSFEQSRLLNSDPSHRFLAAELATNGPAVQKTIAEVHQILS